MKRLIIIAMESIKILKISIDNTMKNLRYLKNYKNVKASHIEYQILLTVHSIEKGMCLKDVRYGFGKTKIQYLVKLLKLYKQKGYDVNSYAFLEGQAVLYSYIKFHENNNYKLDYLMDMQNDIEELLSVDKIFSNIAGIKTYTSEYLKSGKSFNFNSFISSRHSIRYFSNEEVTDEEIKNAIEMAQKAPSACNRQPNRVYYSLSAEKNAQIDDIIPGNQGFSGYVNKYLIVTCDMEAFGSLEINQWYVNGGIYSAFLLLAFHSLGIGTCVFQWASIKEKDKKLREIAGIPRHEQIVLVIGVGKYPDNLNIPIALRKKIDDIMKTF